MRSRHHDTTSEEADSDADSAENDAESDDQFGEIEALTSLASAFDAPLGPGDNDQSESAGLPDLSRSSDEGLIQRISLGDLDPSAIISQIEGFFSSSDSAAQGAEGESQSHASESEGQLQEHSSQFQQASSETADQGKQVAQQGETTSRETESHAVQETDHITQAGAQAGSALSGIGPMLGPMLSIAEQVTNPAGPAA